MDNLKFRAWVPSTKHMRYPDKYPYSENNFRICLSANPNLIPKLLFISDNPYGYTLKYNDKNGNYDTIEDAIVMQFVGLKDKNKTEIYKDDILLIPDFYHERILDDGSGPNEPFNHLAQVVFNNGCFGVNILESGQLLHKRFYTFIELESEGVEWIEVVGNLYENPELVGGLK